MLPESTASSFISRLRSPKPSSHSGVANDSYRETRELFCELYGPQVRVWALTRLRLQATDADDFTQEVLLAALEKIHQYKEKNSFRGWLWMILKNQVRMWRRKHKNEPQVTGGSTFHEIIESLPDDAPNSDVLPANIDEERLIELLRSHGCNQEEPTLRAFIHYCILNREPAVVAEELGLSKSMVY